MAKARYVELKLVSRKRKHSDNFYRSGLNMRHENLRPPHQNREKSYRWQRELSEGP